MVILLLGECPPTTVQTLTLGVRRMRARRSPVSESRTESLKSGVTLLEPNVYSQGSFKTGRRVKNLEDALINIRVITEISIQLVR